jgi:hypothetical protein
LVKSSSEYYGDEPEFSPFITIEADFHRTSDY